MIPHGRGSPYVNEAGVREYYAYQSFYKGKRALTRIIETYEKTLPDGIMDYARALVFMGDWLTVQRRVLGRRPPVSTGLSRPGRARRRPGAGG